MVCVVSLSCWWPHSGTFPLRNIFTFDSLWSALPMSRVLRVNAEFQVGWLNGLHLPSMWFMRYMYRSSSVAPWIVVMIQPIVSQWLRNRICWFLMHRVNSADFPTGSSPSSGVYWEASRHFSLSARSKLSMYLPPAGVWLFTSHFALSYDRQPFF